MIEISCIHIPKPHIARNSKALIAIEAVVRGEAKEEMFEIFEGLCFKIMAVCLICEVSGYGYCAILMPGVYPIFALS